MARYGFPALVSRYPHLFAFPTELDVYIVRVEALTLYLARQYADDQCEVRGDDIGGIAVHIGARVSALAGPNGVLVSSTQRDLAIGSGLEFEERGAHQLKGVPLSKVPRLAFVTDQCHSWS